MKKKREKILPPYPSFPSTLLSLGQRMLMSALKPFQPTPKDNGASSQRGGHCRDLEVPLVLRWVPGTEAGISRRNPL